jgi:hypothetical protein
MKITQMLMPFLFCAGASGCRSFDIFQRPFGNTSYEIVFVNGSIEDLHHVEYLDAPGPVVCGELVSGGLAFNSDFGFLIPEKATISYEDSKGVRRQETLQVRSQIKNPDSFHGAIIFDFSEAGLSVKSLEKANDAFDFRDRQVAAARLARGPK